MNKICNTRTNCLRIVRDFHVCLASSSPLSFDPINGIASARPTRFVVLANAVNTGTVAIWILLVIVRSVV